MKPYLIDGKQIIIKGRFLKTARLQDEFFDPVDSPQNLIAEAKQSRIGADLLTFVQGIHDRAPKYDFKQEWENMAVLPLTTYDHWLNKQLTFKPRNKLRKALKSGVEIKVVEFNDELVRGIMEVFNENPIRQGQRNMHFGKDFETLKRENSAFLERSDFIGAYFEGKIIGFSKVVHTPNYSILMKILSMVSQRDKAPTNAILAKTVEVCTARKSPSLTYSVWGKRPGLNEFKAANGFERVQIPRYFVPLTAKGKLALKANLYRPLQDRLPDKLVLKAAELRAKWTELRYNNKSTKPVTQLERDSASVAAR